MACGADLVGVDEIRQRTVRGAVCFEHLAYDEAHVTRLVLDVPGVGAAGRLTARQREQWSSHHVARGRPGSEQLAVFLRRAPQSVGKDDQRVRSLTRRVTRSRPCRVPDGRDECARRPCRACPSQGGVGREVSTNVIVVVATGVEPVAPTASVGAATPANAVKDRSRPQATTPDSATRRIPRIPFSLPDETPWCHKPIVRGPQRACEPLGSSRLVEAALEPAGCGIAEERRRADQDAVVADVGRPYLNRPSAP